MSKLPKNHPYRRHAENFRTIAGGLTQAERQHKDAIRRGDSAATEFTARIHQLMVGLMAEAAIAKIVADPAGFNEKERELLLREKQLDRWLRSVELAFRRHYSVPLHLEIDSNTTTRAVAEQYTRIVGLLEGALRVIIADRNKLAHAQWKWKLNFKETTIEGPAPPPLNYRAIERRSRVIVAIAALIHDLVTSEPTFQRDYDAHFDEIIALQDRLEGEDYDDLVTQLRGRRRPER